MFSHRYQQQHLHSSRVLYHHHHLASVWRGLFFPHGCTLIPCANVLPAHKTTQNRYHFVSFWCLLKLSLCVWIFFSLVFILLPVGWYCFRFIRVQYAEPLILVMGLKQMAFVTVGFALLADCLLLMWFFFFAAFGCAGQKFQIDTERQMLHTSRTRTHHSAGARVSCFCFQWKKKSTGPNNSRIVTEIISIGMRMIKRTTKSIALIWNSVS